MKKSHSSWHEMVKYEIKLIPVTPIHVWSGQNAIVGIDAFIQENNLYLLSEKDLELLTPQDFNVILHKKAEEGFAYAFRTLLARKLIKPVAEVKTVVSPKAQVRLLHRNIVPGSTLKGYIRTALIRYLISFIPMNQVAGLITRGIDLNKKPAHVSTGLEAVLLRKPRLRKQGGFVDAMESIYISDPEVVNVKFSLRKLSVVHRFNPKSVVVESAAVVLDPLMTEALKYSVSIVISQIPIDKVMVSRETTPSELEKLLEFKKSFAIKLSGRDFILNALRTHGCKSIDLELAKIHESLSDYRRLLEDLKASLCREESNCVPARIGFMTGHESKTVLDIVNQFSTSTYNDVVSYMQQQIGHAWNALTLKLVEYEGKLLGPGWCRLCLE